MDAPLGAREAAWLESHLADCHACRTIAEAYAADRLLLRQLREQTPEPPRDLWARTAGGIEREASTHAPARRPPPRRATSLPALSALSGLAVVGVVVVATAISSGLLGRGPDNVAASPPIALASLGASPQPTAIAVGAGKVQWLGAGEDGAFAYIVADVDAVCPYNRQPDCPELDGHAKRVNLTAIPKYVFQSPIDDQAVVVGTDPSGADAVIVVALPTPDPTPDASVTQDPAPTEVVDSPAPSPAITPTPTPTVSPLIVAPTDLPTVTPSDATSASLASGSPTASEVTSPQPSEATAVAIITNVAVVGRSAAYSPDGMWFAFSARPADGSAGPDIYVWHVGDLQARPVTSDHASVFASWVGGSVLGSRVVGETIDQPSESLAIESPGVIGSPEVPPPSDVPASAELNPSAVPSSSVEPTPGPEAVPQAFIVDPWTGMEVLLIDAEWQPAVDPTGLAVVAWQGTVRVGSDGLTTGPATGNLVVHPFHGPLETEDPLGSPSASVASDASPTLSPEPSIDVSVSLEPTALASPEVQRDFPAQIVVAGPIADFDARWDDTGTWLAIWIADAIDPGLGRLSLLRFDPTTGLIDRPEGAPQEVTALPGFSIGMGRLAWASPPGQGGEGSRIQIAAWTDDEVGAIESIPVEGAIVVQ